MFNVEIVSKLDDLTRAPGIDANSNWWASCKMNPYFFSFPRHSFPRYPYTSIDFILVLYRSNQTLESFRFITIPYSTNKHWWRWKSLSGPQRVPCKRAEKRTNRIQLVHLDSKSRAKTIALFRISILPPQPLLEGLVLKLSSLFFSLK